MSETYYQVRKGKKTERRQRDVIMKASKDAAYVILAIENQQDIDYRMPVRQMEYDVMEYRRQMKEIETKNRKEKKRRKRLKLPSLWKHAGELLTGFRKEDRLLPVVTVVFYHGLEEYDGCRDLHDMLKWNRENMKYKRFVSNYSLNLVTLRDLQEERFQTGLRELIGVMKRSQDRDALYRYCEENEARFRELDEDTVEAIGVMINYPKLNAYRNEKGEMKMCKALEDLRREGFEEGIEKGITQSIQLLIESCCELGNPKEAVEAKVIEKFGLESDEVRAYFDKYWK